MDSFDPIDSLPRSCREKPRDAVAPPSLSLNRRSFLKCAALLGLSASCPLGALKPAPVRAEAGHGLDERFVKEARFYEKLPHKKIRCVLCPRLCEIDDIERGYCGVRENHGGTYYTLVHSRPCTYHADPIEKKPFYHFRPGTMSFSIATAGCNVNCKFCQNWEISQARPEQLRSIHLPPEKVASMAVENGCASIAYTYSEPIIFYEYMMDTAKAGRERGVASVVVTGGYISLDPLKQLCAQVDAIKVDLKAYSESYYRDVVSGELKPVLEALVTMANAGTWTEIVYLVVPTLNDSDKELAGLARWIKTNLGTDVPVHFSRFHPQYLLKNLPPTPVKTLERAKAIADAEGLHYVYLGNVPGHKGEDTYCPGCGKAVVERVGYSIRNVLIRDGKCSFCGHGIAGVWE